MPHLTLAADSRALVENMKTLVLIHISVLSLKEAREEIGANREEDRCQPPCEMLDQF